MSLSKPSWSLKDKQGCPPSRDDYIWKAIAKLDRSLLFPCSRTVDELEMPKQEKAPREMNSFMLFRRHLAYITKQANSYDGKILSRLASYIWNGASPDERKGYSDIASELKHRHYEKYPDYTYERRKRKTEDEDFINLNAEELVRIKKTKKSKTSDGSSPREQEYAHAQTFPEPTSQESGNVAAWLTLQDASTDEFCLENNNTNTLSANYNSITNDFYNNTFETSPGFTISNDVDIPRVANAVLSTNYTTITQEELIILQQQQLVQLKQQLLQLQQQQQQSQYLEQYNNIIRGDFSAGIDQHFRDETLALEAPVDEFLINRIYSQY